MLKITGECIMWQSGGMWLKSKLSIKKKKNIKILNKQNYQQVKFCAVDFPQKNVFSYI